MKSLEQRLHDGSRAKEVLENEQFIASFDAIEKEVIDQWKTSQSGAVSQRERLFLYLEVLQKVKAQLVSTLETGQLAALELQHKQTLKERFANGLTSWAQS